MSIFRRDTLEPETVRDIESKISSRQHGKSNRLQWSCGCYEWGADEIALCEWHLGMDYGVEIGKSSQ